MYREGTLKKLKVKVLNLYIIEEKLKRSREALKQEKIDLVTIDIAKKMIEGSKVLDESDCDDDVDKDDIEDGNDENVLEEIWEDHSDDDIEGDSNENQEEDESVQEENNPQNLSQTMRYGRTCRTWRGRARAADFPWIEKIFLLLFAKLLWTIYLLFKLSGRQEFSKWQWGCQWFSLLVKALGFVNIVNTNTFFYSNEKIIVSKLPSYGFSRYNIWILKMSSQRRVTIFWAHIFEGGSIFGLLTWEGLKFFGPRFWNNTAPPPIINDCSLKL